MDKKINIEGLSGKQISVLYVAAFEAWLAEMADLYFKDRQVFKAFIYAGKLNNVTVAKACGFKNRKNINTNTHLVELMETIEADLLAVGVLVAKPAKADQADKTETLDDKAIKKLKAEVNRLQAENVELQTRLESTKISAGRLSEHAAVLLEIENMGKE